jgi:hypothetical protein
MALTCACGAEVRRCACTCAGAESNAGRCETQAGPGNVLHAPLMLTVSMNQSMSCVCVGRAGNASEGFSSVVRSVLRKRASNEGGELADFGLNIWKR